MYSFNFGYPQKLDNKFHPHNERKNFSTTFFFILKISFIQISSHSLFYWPLSTTFDSGKKFLKLFCVLSTFAERKNFKGKKKVPAYNKRKKYASRTSEIIEIFFYKF
jgi:hypothetical protein